MRHAQAILDKCSSSSDLCARRPSHSAARVVRAHGRGAGCIAPSHVQHAGTPARIVSQAAHVSRATTSCKRLCYLVVAKLSSQPCMPLRSAQCAGRDHAFHCAGRNAVIRGAPSFATVGRCPNLVGLLLKKVRCPFDMGTLSARLYLSAGRPNGDTAPSPAPLPVDSNRDDLEGGLLTQPLKQRRSVDVQDFPQ